MQGPRALPYSAAVGAESSSEAIAGLDIRPPERLAVGPGNAFVIAGHCYHPDLRTRRLWVEVAGSRQPADRWALPRRDVFERARNGGEPGPRAFRSGFVATPTVGAVDATADAEVALVLSLADGSEARAAVARIRLEPELPMPEATPDPFAGDAGPRVAICMATYNPPAELLRRQLDSIREQTHRNWVCLISDDDSEPAALENLEREIVGDRRFVLARGRRLGFSGNFERALSMAPPSADYVTLCDQDDRWHPEKLERLLRAIADGAQLAYSDARVVDPSGELIHPSYWMARRNNYTNFGSLLLANSVTGAASLFRRGLLDDVLPLPPNLGSGFHDHWLAIVALALGRIAYVDKPLWDYVQHPGAVIGHSTANRRPNRRVRQHLRNRLRSPGTGARVVYYYKLQQQLLYAKVLRLRCWERMAPAKRRAVRHLLNADRGFVGLSWLLGRRIRRLWGHDETLDRELSYAYALVSRRAVSLWTVGRRRPNRLLPRDASIPPPPPVAPPSTGSS
jgi:glycosyltransferase involved in cell wall biosynthesis